MMTDNDQAKKGYRGARGDKAVLKTVNLDSPYYLHPSDDLGRVLVTSPLTGENFHTWRRAMQNALHAKNKMGFVDGTLKKPSATCPEFLAWTKCNSMVMSWILNALSRELHDNMAYAESAAEAHEPVPTSSYGCTCGAKKEFTRTRETEKVHQFLMGLNENFSTIHSQILNMEPLPSLNKVYSMATKEEKQQMVSASRSPAIEAMALAEKTSYNEKVSTSGKPRCDNCKSIGHTKERCYEIISYPANVQLILSGYIRLNSNRMGQLNSIKLDDIVITSNDGEKLAALKAYLHKEFSIKDLGLLKYFLGVEVARTTEGIILSQQKYALNILTEAGLLGVKPSHFLLDQNHRLALASGPLASDPSQ
ncbi:hypothetical protein SLEP1_g18226 [Rubroshorea leprosula]|uniref:Retrotransposon Copia-like N-terminal domain-containing protein n=1 Tax=Rubroshorea leprosula TaxID=152421 RepID=A0AAV5J0D6_9ROSI|nr:hypothetical protein SLEP1_g18226 [Rubroshorea leprosula]